MKKILNILLCGFLALSLTACGSNSETKENKNDTKEEVKESYSSSIAKDAKNYYGKTVTNYTVEGLDYKWKIFYADDNYIYLITSDIINYTDIPSKNGKTVNHIETDRPKQSVMFGVDLLDQYEGSKDVPKSLQYLNQAYFDYLKEDSTTRDAKLVAYLMDTDIWSKFVNPEYADIAIGGPSLEMAIKSHNAKNDTHHVYKVESAYGYTIGTDESYYSGHAYDFFDSDDNLYVMNDDDKAVGTIMCSPVNEHYVYTIDNSGSIEWNDSSLYGIRPVVRLNKDVKLVEDGRSYKLVK